MDLSESKQAHDDPIKLPKEKVHPSAEGLGCGDPGAQARMTSKMAWLCAEAPNMRVMRAVLSFMGV